MVTAPAPAADADATAEAELRPPCMADLITLARTAPDGPHPDSKATLRDLYEADVACISVHLAALQTHVFPVARRALPDGRRLTFGLTLLAREHERLLRVIHANLRGDVHTSVGVMQQLQTELADLVEELQLAEEDLADRLEEALPQEEVARLADRLERALAHGPTRPHPHATHRKGLRRLSFRLCSILDHSLDTMESRTVTTV